MTMTLNEMTQAGGISDRASGRIVTDSAAAAAVTITCGFTPRMFRIDNLTDRISNMWFDGVDNAAVAAAIAGIEAKLDADAGVTDEDYAATWTPASATYADMRAAVVGLLAKLDADATVTGTTYAALWTPAAPSYAALKVALAGLAAKLDADTGVTDTDYAATWGVTANALHTAANGTRTLETTSGVLVNSDGSVTLSATTMAASKAFAWEAIG